MKYIKYIIIDLSLNILNNSIFIFL